MRVKRVCMRDIGQSYPCMNDLPPQFSAWREALPESRRWFKQHLGRGVEGYHLQDGNRVIGHIYYAPSEEALIPIKTEEGVACIYCVSLEQGYQGKGHGKMLFDVFKRRLKRRGFKGILVDATEFPGYMHHSHFSKQGFQTIKEHRPFKIMYFPLTKEVVEASPMEVRYKPSTGKVEVTLFRNFFCPVGVAVYHLVKRAAEEFGDAVEIVEMEATRGLLDRYGVVEGVLINGKRKIMGPASEEEVRKAIQEEVDKP